MCDAEADAVDPDCGWSCFDDATDCIDLLIKGSLCVKESDEEVPAPSKLCLCDCEVFGENSIKARCLSVLISAGFLFTLADVVMEGISLHSALTTQRVMGSKVESRYANTWLAFYILFTAFCIPMELLLIWYRHFGLMALLDRILLRRHNKVAPEVDAEATIESSDGETEQGLDDEVRKTSNHGTGKATDDELGTQYGSSIKCSDDVIGKDLNDGITKASSGGPRKAPDVGAREQPGSTGVRPLYVIYAWAGGTTHRWKEVIIQSLLTIKTLLVLFMGYGQLVFAISAEGNYKWFHGDLNQSTTTFLFFTALTGFLINYFHLYKDGVNQNHHIVRNLFSWLSFYSLVCL